MSDFPPMVKYMDIARLGHEDNYGILDTQDDVVTITEKVDGGNGQFRLYMDEIKGPRFLFGTRNNHFTIDTHSPQQKQFGENAQYVADIVKDPTKLNPDYIYFGEWMKKHTLQYDWAATPKFVGFDIFCLSAGNFIPDAPMREEFERLGIPTIPLIFKGKISEVDITRLENFIGRTKFGECQMEGIVIKNYFRKSVYGRQLFAKIVRQEFKELNQVTFGGGSNLNKLTDDTSKFIDTYYTDARIRKAILRLLDDGMKLDRSLMHHLPKAVSDDTWKEESWDVIKDFNMVRFDIIKKNAPKKCLMVLDTVIKERFLESANKGMEMAGGQDAL